MESLLQQLELEIPAFAEGARVEGLPPRERVALAWDLIEAYAEGLQDIRESIFDIARDLHRVGLDVAAPLSYVFDPGPATHLTGRLHDLTRTLGMFRSGYLAPEQAVEEVHTAAETLLREAVGPAGSFADKAQRAHDAGHLSHEAYEAFIELKDRRKRAKHQGQGIEPVTALDLVNETVRGMQALLLAVVRRAQGAGANGAAEGTGS
jgi:hypothetical protein